MTMPTTVAPTIPARITYEEFKNGHARNPTLSNCVPRSNNICEILGALVDFGDQITKFTTKVQVQLSSLLNSLVKGTTLLNTVMKCDGIESEEDPKHTFEQ